MTTNLPFKPGCAAGLSLALLALSAPALAQISSETLPVPPGEEAVDPYEVSDSNAGAAPISDPRVLDAFHGADGISRIVDDLVDHAKDDPRIEDIMAASDFVRLRRTLKEQICYLLGGGCSYSGRDMASVHEDHGITLAEFNVLVELLQDAMDREGVPFRMQNRLLAILAPMKREIVVR